MSKVMGVVFIAVAAAVFILMYMFMTQAVGTTDMGINLSGTQYQGAYNDSVNASKVGISFLGYVPQFLGISGLIMALFLIFAYIKTR